MRRPRKEPDYNDYGPGKELRELVDQHATALGRMERASDEVIAAAAELRRIERVMAAMAEHMRLTQKRGRQAR
jgi:hypothetical protein